MDAAHVSNARLRDDRGPCCGVVADGFFEHALEGANQSLVGTVGGGVEHRGGHALEVKALHQGVEGSLVLGAAVSQLSTCADGGSARSSASRYTF
jgi:hypothetical protein